MIITYIELFAVVWMMIMIMAGILYVVPVQRIKNICSMSVAFALSVTVMPYIMEQIPFIKTNRYFVAGSTFFAWIVINAIINWFVGLFWKKDTKQKINGITVEYTKPESEGLSDDESREMLREMGVQNVSKEALSYTTAKYVVQTMGLIVAVLLLLFSVGLMFDNPKTDIGINLRNPISPFGLIVFAGIIFIGTYFLSDTIIARLKFVTIPDKSKLPRISIVKRIVALLTAIVKGGVAIVLLYCFLAMGLSPEMLKKSGEKSLIVQHIQSGAKEISPYIPTELNMTVIEQK